jgi:diacylglycerol O-acyltransferase 1
MAEKEKKKKKENDDSDVKVKPSLFETGSYSRHGYSGFVNLAVLLLFLMNFRLVAENLIKYGWLFVEKSSSFETDWKTWPSSTICIVTTTCMCLGCVLIERWALRCAQLSHFVFSIKSLFVGALIVLPNAAIWLFSTTLGAGILASLWCTCIWMKAVSYFQTNWNAGQRRRQVKKNDDDKDDDDDDDDAFPSNLTIRNIANFVLMPTLVYELRFRKIPKIRWMFVLKRTLAAIFLSMLIYVIALQYILPVLEKTKEPLENRQWLKVLERVLKLSIPLFYIWLLGFYVIFHLYLNIWGELMRLADREFFSAWWQSTELGYFWRTWNTPVHRWMVACIYTPLLNRNVSKRLASLACFFVSAIFHEVVVSVPFRTVKMWAFLAMLIQVPAIELSKPLRGTTWGNIQFWLTLVIGLPICTVIYYAYAYHI